MLDDLELFRALDPQTLHLIVLPTEKCNFRCVYCYEDFAIGRMAPEIVHSLKLFLSRRLPELSDLHISWFGGEPLLASSVIKDIMQHVQSVRQHSLALTSDVTSNGYLLTPPLLEELLQLGIRTYQISLDGSSADHNQRRPLCNGGGTFDRIWSNLVAAKRSKHIFSIVVRVHVDRHNLAHLPSFIEEFAREFSTDERFLLYIRKVSRLGGKNDSFLPVLAADSTDQISGLRTYARAVGAKMFEIDEDTYVCYAAKPNSLVIRANGQIVKCTVAFTNDMNDVGRLLSDGRVNIDIGKVRRWANGLETGDRDQLTCPLVAHIAKDLGMSLLGNTVVSQR